MPDKLTDAEVKKALECCSTYHDVSSCQNCPLDGKCEPNLLEQYALDLINRLEHRIHQQEKTIMEIQNANLIDFKGTIANYKAENESLKAEVERLKEVNDSFTDIGKLYSEIKAEAYREFADRLKDESEHFELEKENFVSEEQIDNLLNELAGDKIESN